MLPKIYDYEAVEARLYKFWEENGFFKPSNDPNKPGHDPTKKPYVISMPPPNVTGALHLGHVMFVTLEDLMIRHQRMKGALALFAQDSESKLMEQVVRKSDGIVSLRKPGNGRKNTAV